MGTGWHSGSITGWTHTLHRQQNREGTSGGGGAPKPHSGGNVPSPRPRFPVTARQPAAYWMFCLHMEGVLTVGCVRFLAVKWFLASPQVLPACLGVPACRCWRYCTHTKAPSATWCGHHSWLTWVGRSQWQCWPAAARTGACASGGARRSKSSGISSSSWWCCSEAVAGLHAFDQ